MPRSSTWRPLPFPCTSGGSTSTTPRGPAGRVGYEEFLQHIASRLHLAPSARDRLALRSLNLDHPYWISDPNFDLEYHVRHVALPRPGDWTQLMRLAGRLHSLPLDLTKPLWEFWLVEGLDAIPRLPAGSYAIIWKLHHAAADAMGSAELLSVLHDTSPDAKPMAAVEPWVADREPGQLELLIRDAVQQPASAVPHCAARRRGRPRAAAAPRPPAGATRREAQGGASGTPDALQRPHPRAAPGDRSSDLRSGRDPRHQANGSREAP